VEKVLCTGESGLIASAEPVPCLMEWPTAKISLDFFKVSSILLATKRAAAAQSYTTHHQ